MAKQVKSKYEYEIGSNVVKLEDETLYLDVIVWEEVSDDFIKEHIIK